MNELLATPIRNVIECIESWHDDEGNWYRIYSDGFIEQGGRFSSRDSTVATITFHKEFSNNKYYINKVLSYNSSSANSIRGDCFFNLTTTTAQTYGWTNAISMWYACGW